MLARLKAIRIDQALSQRELAVEAGVTQATIVNAEKNGTDIRPSTQRKLAEALSVHPSELIGERA